MTAAYLPKPDSYFEHARTEIEPLLPKHAERVLEIGCGAGATLKWLKANGRCSKTFGIELVGRAADAARLWVDRVEEGDAEVRLDRVLADGPFDLVLCLDVLEHMQDPWRFVARLADALPPGATLIASLPNVRHYRVSMSLLFLGHWRYAGAGVLDRTHLRFFTKDSVPKLFDGASFEIQAIQGSTPPMGSGSWWADRATLGAMQDFFSVQYLVSARRR